MNDFISQALVFIGATVLIAPIFKLTGFGSVLGYLIAGIIVGPHALKLIKDPGNVMHFAEIGVIFLLFIIGLEIEPRKLLEMRKPLMRLGLLQITTTTALFTVIGYYLDFDIYLAFIIGFALSLSSTAFAIQFLLEKNQFKTLFGKGSFSILLAQDLVAIPILAMIPLIVAKNEVISEGLTYESLLYFVLLIAALIFASRYLIRPFFRFIGSTRTRELFTASALLIVFGVAFLTLKIGLSAALGTFIAGVLLADSEYSHELEVNIEPFKSLLMGLFFIGVGMNVSLPLIFSKPLLVAGLAIGYLSIKTCIIYLIGRSYKLSHENSKLMSLAINQGGEFAFVIFGMVYSFGVVESDVIGILTAVITVSMALSSILNMLNDYLTSKKSAPSPQYDEIPSEENAIIIAGLGRFGQIFARILRSQGYSFVAIEHDSSQVEALRKFGHKVYYGDASREDILEKAGIQTAKYLILAIQDVRLSIATAKVVREKYPHVKIFARSRNRAHNFQLMDLGVTFIKRDTFDSAVAFVGNLLNEMGFSPERTEGILERFKIHDEQMLLEQSKVYHDEGQFLNLVRQGHKQLEEVMEEESKKSYIKS